MRSIPAVNAIFLRMSATWNALRIVESIFLRLRLAVDHPARAARRLYALTSGCAEGVRVHRQRLLQLALREHLDRHALARRESAALQQLERHLGARVEARVERPDVHRLRARAERLERHRLLHVRPAQLSHAHVDRHLPALERDLALRSRTRPRALLPAARRLA